MLDLDRGARLVIPVHEGIDHDLTYRVRGVVTDLELDPSLHRDGVNLAARRDAIEQKLDRGKDRTRTTEAGSQFTARARPVLVRKTVRRDRCLDLGFTAEHKEAGSRDPASVGDEPQVPQQLRVISLR